MTNSTLRSGGMPGNSSGKTSGKSHTTSTSCISGGVIPSIKYRLISGERGMVVDGGLDVGDLYYTVTPGESVTMTVLAAQSSLAWYFRSQSMPRMASKPESFKDTKGNGKGQEPNLI